MRSSARGLNQGRCEPLEPRKRGEKPGFDPSVLIVKDLQASIAYYIDRLGFQLDYEGPADHPFYAGVSRDGIGIMLKAIRPDVLPCPNHVRHEWARWDASIYALDPDVLFDEFSQRGVSFVKKLSFIDEGLWASRLRMPTGMFLRSFRFATNEVIIRGTSIESITRGARCV